MTNARCWVTLPSSLPPHHLPHSHPPICTPPILSAQTGGCTKVCWPPPFAHPPHLLTPFAQTTPLVWPPPLHPPSHCMHPDSTPSPFSCKWGHKWGRVHPPPACVWSAPPCLALPLALPCLPCLTLPALCFACMPGVQEGQCAIPPPFSLRAAVPSAWLHALHPLCTHAGGREDRASSLPFHLQEGTSAWAAPS